MYSRLSRVMFPVFAFLFVGAIVWGYQEHQEKNAVLIKAENQYQRAFHDLSHHMSRLHDELGQTLAISAASDGMQRRGLVNVWRLTSEAQNEINQLPLALLPFNRAEQFLARISDFAYRTAIRDLKKQPLTEEERKTMKSLYAKSADISRELGKVQDAVLKDRLRWMDVEVAMASKDNPHDNTIIDGFKAVDKKIGEYPENEWGPSAMSTERRRTEAELQGKPFSPEEIGRKAAELARTIGLRREAEPGVQVTENGKDTELPGYTATLKGPNGENIQMDFTRKGGHLLWFMNPREVREQKLDFEAARRSAADFLDRAGYRGLAPVAYDRYDHVAVITYAVERGGVRIYPDKLTVRIALDNGEPVGLQAADHVFAPRVLTDGRAAVPAEQARRSLDPGFRVEDVHLAVIENGERKPVLCHAFTGRINGDRYRIFINANTGAEETVEQLSGSEKPLLSD